MGGMLPFTQAISKNLILICAAALLLLTPGVTSGEATNAAGISDTGSSGVSGGEIGIVTATRLNVRKLPDRNQEIVQILKQGARVLITDRHDGWLQIYFDDQMGYIRNREQYIKITNAAGETREDPGRTVKEEIDSKTISRKIKTHEDEVLAYGEREVEIINGLNELDLALNEVNQRVAALKVELAEGEAVIQEIMVESAGLINTIQIDEEYIAGRLVALYKLNLVGRIHVLASADSMYKILHRKFAMEQILKYDEMVLTNHMQNKEKLTTLLEDLNQRKRKKLLTKADFERQKKIMDHRRTKRKKLLEEIQNKKSLSLATIESLKQAAHALDQAIMSMHVEPLEETNNALNEFASYKGLLEMPVKGKITSFFGSQKNRRLNVINFNSGIEIEADRGEPIRAVLNGIVLFSGWFKSYGNMIIIDHGNHYYTVYAHTEELFKSKGEPVEKLEVIATVGDTSSMSGSNLYFEVRHYGRSMNPLKWLKSG
jgi:septal ring factor EnvC (AmiA/AmiB activator)